MIDCGKTFYQNAIREFVNHKRRRLSGVILTHDHADAIFGLDDLRAWTTGQASRRIQDVVDVYLTAECFVSVKEKFPYLVERNKATGKVIFFYICGVRPVKEAI